MSKKPSSSSSQSSVSRSISIVRLALVTSVTCTPPSAPPVRFHSTQVSVLPKIASPRSAASRDAVDVLQDPLDLAAGEVGRGRQPGLAPDDVAAPVALQRRGDRGRCGCPARRWRCSSGRPVVRSQTTAVSRWLVMPSAARSDAVRLACVERGLDHGARCAPRSRSGCARPSRPAAGSARARAGGWPTSLPPWSKIMNRVLVVPWSTAPTKSAMVDLLLVRCGGSCGRRAADARRARPVRPVSAAGRNRSIRGRKSAPPTSPPMIGATIGNQKYRSAVLVARTRVAVARDERRQPGPEVARRVDRVAGVGAPRHADARRRAGRRSSGPEVGQRRVVARRGDREDHEDQDRGADDLVEKRRRSEVTGSAAVARQGGEDALGLDGVAGSTAAIRSA